MVKLLLDDNNNRYHITLPGPIIQSLGWRSGEELALNIDKQQKTILIVKL